MKKGLTVIVAVALGLLSAWSLKASDLPAYAPEKTDLILFANLNRISNSRLVQKILQLSPELQQSRKELADEVRKETGMDLDEMLNSELCVFGNFAELDKSAAFQMLALSNTGKAAAIFDFIVQQTKSEQSAQPPIIGEINGVRIIRDQETAMLLRDSRTLQFSYCENDPAKVISTPLAKTDLPVARDVDTGALLSIAVDLKNADIPAEIRNDETYKDILRGLTKVTFNFSEKGENVIGTSVSTYSDEQSAEAALAAAQKFVQGLKQDLAKPETVNDPVAKLIAGLLVQNMRRDGNCVISTTSIGSEELLRLIGLLMVASAQ